MSESHFLPYRYANDSLEMTIHGVAVDGAQLDLDTYANHGSAHLNLAILEQPWNTVELDIGVADANNQMKSVVPDETNIANVDVWAVLRNKYTRLRKGLELIKGKDGVWRGKLGIKRTDVVRATDLVCYAVLSKDLVARPGFAFKKGNRIADSTEWKIYTDAVPTMPGGALNSEWRNFAKDENLELRVRHDCVWFLDLADPESPRLLLNESVPGLRGTLEVSQKTGKAARVRDSLVHSILQAVLLELAVYALTESRSSAESLEDLPDWQQKMLLVLARKNGSSTEQLKVEEWLSDWKNGESTALVLRDLATCIQRHLNLVHSSEHLVKSLEREMGNE